MRKGTDTPGWGRGRSQPSLEAAGRLFFGDFEQSMTLSTPWFSASRIERKQISVTLNHWISKPFAVASPTKPAWCILLEWARMRLLTKINIQLILYNNVWLLSEFCNLSSDINCLTLKSLREREKQKHFYYKYFPNVVWDIILLKNNLILLSET